MVFYVGVFCVRVRVRVCMLFAYAHVFVWTRLKPQVLGVLEVNERGLAIFRAWA